MLHALFLIENRQNDQASTEDCPPRQPLGVYMPDSPHPLTGGPSVDSVERSFLSELQASLEPAEQPAAAASPLLAAGVCLAAAAPAAAPTQPAADPDEPRLSLDILAEESEAAAQALARRVRSADIEYDEERQDLS